MKRLARTTLALAALLALLAPLARFATRPALAAPDFRQHRREGQAHYRARRYFQAIESLEKALAEAPDDERGAIASDLSRAHAGLGFEFLDGGESRRAREAFETAIEAADDYYARFGLGYVYFLRREDGKSLTHLLASLQLRPEYAYTNKLVGILKYRQGDTEEALRRLRKARALDTKDDETVSLIDRWSTEMRITDEFPTTRTRHFAVRADPRLPQDLRTRLTAMLDEAWDDLGDRLGVWPEDRVPAILYSESRFRRATGMAHWVGGLYDGQLKFPVPVPKKSSGAGAEKAQLASLEAVVRHEYTHVLVRAIAPECPTWLNEGIAQYLEGRTTPEQVYRQLRVGRDRRIPLANMPAQLGTVENVELARWIYLQGLGFVEFLAAEFQPFRLRLLLRAIDDEHSISRAFERTYGRSIEDLEKLWWDAIEAVDG